MKLLGVPAPQVHRDALPADLLPAIGHEQGRVLKLFAGGIQDSWDIEQLLAVGDRNALSAEVEGRLGELSADCADLWKKIGER